jgi:hypothetical protein
MISKVETYRRSNIYKKSDNLAHQQDTSSIRYKTFKTAHTNYILPSPILS